MSTPDRNKVREIFAEALNLPADGVAGFLDRACQGDGALREEVESLLAAIARRPSFLSAPTGDPSPGVPGTAGETPGSLIGAYKLLEEIGHGGFGTVYMAEQSQPVRRRVALKIIKLGMDTRGVVARFEAERQALAMMDHPNIAQVHDAGATESGRPYFVMELVRGEPITAFADRAGLGLDERLQLFLQVCHAVQHAHSKGVIHRDIKPGNVLVTTQDGRPHAKVIDFGIAKATQHRLTERTLFTEFHQFIGTPEYMSPEQAGGAPDVDTRSDVYSLGTLLYELLTGATPFDSKALRAAAFDEIRRIIREDDPPAPSTRLSRASGLAPAGHARRDSSVRLAARVSGDLDWIVMKAMEKDRTRRYATASALADDVQRHLAGDPVSAAPPSTWYRVRKFIARHRALVLSTGAVAGALVLGIVGTTLGIMSANEARNDAQNSATRAEKEAQRAGEAENAALRAKEQAEYDAYIANMESAYSALQFNDTTRLRTRLDACPPVRRNWEWRFLHAATDGSEVVMTHPERWVTSASMSADGSRLITSCNDGKARLWNPATGVELAAWSGPQRFRGKVGFSPDGVLAFAAASDGRLTVWDTTTLAQVAELHGHTAAITFASFTDKARIVSTSDDGTVRLWDARSGAELRRMKHDEAIHRAALDATGMRLATASRDRTVRIWSLDAEREPTVLRGHTNSVVFVRWSDDGARVVSASYDGSVRVWDVQRGAELSRFSHDARALFATFSPDGTQVVSAATAGPPTVWEASTGKALFRLQGHANAVLGANYSKDGKWIVTNSRDNTVRLWDARTGEEWSCLRGHAETPWVAEFTPDGQHVMTCGDTTARLWPLVQDSEQSIIASPKADSGTIQLAPDERHILETGDKRARWIDVKTGNETPVFDHAMPNGASAISPDGTLILLAFPGHTVRSWDLGKRVEGPALVGHSGRVHGIAHDADGRRVVTASEDGTVRVWDAGVGRELVVLRGHDGAVNSAEFDRAGTRIVTAGRDKTVRVWNAETGHELRTLRGHESAVQYACFNADGTRILSTSAEFAARVWDATTGEHLFVLRGHEHVVFNGGFSPDGTRIVTCSMDGTVRLWDAANGRQILSMRGRSGGITKAEFTADGSRLFYADTEGRAWLLDSIPARERRTEGSR